MWEKYAPEPRMRLNVGIRRRLAPLLDNNSQRIELAHSLLLTLPGSPIIYYGDEIGMGDNIWLPDRNGVRTPMQWNAEPNAGFSDSPIQSLYSPVIDDENYGPAKVNVEIQGREPLSMWNTIRHMIAIRKKHHAFGWGEFEWIDCENDSVAAYRRTFEEETILVFQNLSDRPQKISYIPKRSARLRVDLLTQKEYVSQGGEVSLELAPYQYLWLK
jgi:glycosidase